MPLRLARGLLAATALLLSACAMNPGINPRVEQEALTPPQPIGGGGPALVGATPQQPVSLEILVRIDTLGRADLSTLSLTGQGVEANRQVVADWLRSARFEPAKLNGYVVSGWFHFVAEAKAARLREY
ncbi:MAG TPA: hypothetical protein VFN38_05640 [Gemmatimonadaceae bacterium]|nr:hypothetical protein [Gemmatimonadaceae bacterium]